MEKGREREDYDANKYNRERWKNVSRFSREVGQEGENYRIRFRMRGLNALCNRFSPNRRKGITQVEISVDTELNHVKGIGSCLILSPEFCEASSGNHNVIVFHGVGSRVINKRFCKPRFNVGKERIRKTPSCDGNSEGKWAKPISFAILKNADSISSFSFSLSLSLFLRISFLNDESKMDIVYETNSIREKKKKKKFQC